MVAYMIDVSELKDSEKVEELRTYLERALGVKPVLTDKAIRIPVPEGSNLPKKDVKDVLKRYLHSAGIKGDYRILSAPAPAFKIRKKATE